MTRHARALVRDGALGDVRLVQVEYIQAGSRRASRTARRTTACAGCSIPQRSGLALVMSAIGCHAQHLACFVAGAKIARVVADVGALMPGRKVVDYVVGAARVRRRRARHVHRDAGGRRRRERHPPARLRREGHARLVAPRRRAICSSRCRASRCASIGRGDPFLPPDIIALGRTPRGHPEGLREAFANIYAEVAQERMARALGEPVAGAALSAHRGRRAHDGVHRSLHRVAAAAAGATSRGCRRRRRMTNEATEGD